jgi:glycosyltransferase involved in cell wall biosynthesis
MSLLIKLFWLITATELILWLLPTLKLRRTFAPFVILMLFVISIALFYVHLSIPIGILVFMNLYRMLNLWRLFKARIHEQYLNHVTIQTSIWIIGFQMILLLLWQLSDWLKLSTYHLWLGLVYLDLLGSLILLRTTFRHLQKTRSPKTHNRGIADRELPTITVAIPARNETGDLQDCLESLISSNYPKLEILVLDDASQNKRTPEIIRSFAHDGVIFIQGTEPEGNWLAKNNAYQRLFEASNGDMLLFCGVDIRFKPNSINQLVEIMHFKHKSMISVIPKNILSESTIHRDSLLLQPFRYAWELAIPRKIFHRAPVLSSCWIIQRDVIEHAGGFGAVSRSIIPESYFARVCAVHDGYSFMQSNEEIGITSQKNYQEQISTAIRTRYPQLHRRMELVLIVTLIEAFGVIMPFALIIAALLKYLSLQLTIVSIFTVIALSLIYIQIVILTYRKWLNRSIYALPIATIFDLVILNYSMWRYEFSSVIWKGRNITAPIMHVSEQAHNPN